MIGEDRASFGFSTAPNKSVGAWYVLRVRSRRELWINNWLKTAGHETCLPLTSRVRKWSDRTKRDEVPVFPGYVFCRFDKETRMPVLQTPGVISVLADMKGNPSAIEADEIEALKVLETAKVPVLPWPFLKVGDWVTIVGGALDGLVGILEKAKNTSRVVVSVSLLQRSVAVEIERSEIKPIKKASVA